LLASRYLQRAAEIFHRTIERNEKLEEEVAELKRDLQVWKKAYSDCTAASEKYVEEAIALRKKVADLEGLKVKVRLFTMPPYSDYRLAYRIKVRCCWL
jgi:hypothetical protein